MLKRLLGAVIQQDTNGCFSYSVVVIDNDLKESGKVAVEEFKAASPIHIAYYVEPRQNIALARNLAIDHATGDFIAFIDDDEFPSKYWLKSLLAICQKYSASGVLGPISPYFSEEPPAWVIKGQFAERPRYPTGRSMSWRQSRTGNVLFRKDILSGCEQAFRDQFGTGGEDVDFFERMTRKGCRFVWCNEAEVFEEVPPDRCTRRYHFRRALLRGKNSLKREGYNVGSLAKSIMAIPIYSLVLPFLLVSGQHRFMKYAIKLSDHMGKISALVGLNRIRER